MNRIIGRFLAAVTAFATFSLVSVGASAFATDARAEQPYSVAPGRWISLTELEKSLPPAPIVVGFDIDDTLVFSSPSFNAVLNASDAQGSNPYGADRRAVIANPKTWEDIHAVHDAYVLPKEIGRKLLALHQKRGDRIILITARVNVKGELLEQRLRQMFKVDFAGPIVFTGMKPKTDFIKSNGVQVYYGDSDSDIEYAQAAGIRPVRVVRAGNAIPYDRVPTNGEFGEDVIIDSDR
jgi:acid phosphatase (class B)